MRYFVAGEKDRFFRLVLFFLLAGLLTQGLLLVPKAQAQDLLPDRKESEADTAFGWLVAPTPISLAGVGTSVPVIGMLSNIYEKTDLVLIETLPGGEIDLRGAFIYDLPLVSELFQLSLGNYRYITSIPTYGRDPGFKKDQVVYPLVEQRLMYANARFFFFGDRLEVFFDSSKSTNRYEKIYDLEGNRYDLEHKVEERNHKYYYGLTLDLTDNQTDPRQGTRLSVQRTDPNFADDTYADFQFTDYNLTLFTPFFDRDVLVGNLFASMSDVSRQGSLDEAELAQSYDLGCDKVEANQSSECKRIQELLVQNRLAADRFGSATYLGGLNRLRGYDSFRYKGSRSVYAGIEYRLNFSEQVAPINWILVGGLKTVFQAAFFFETGSVTDPGQSMGDNRKNSYGAGLRALISGLVYRFDIGMGEEGINTNLFVNYPMDIFNVE